MYNVVAFTRTKYAICILLTPLVFILMAWVKVSDDRSLQEFVINQGRKSMYGIHEADPTDEQENVTVNMSKEEQVEILDNVRVLCWVTTWSENHRKRADHVMATWAKRCDKFIFFSDEMDEKLPIVVLDIYGRVRLPNKTKQALDYLYKHHFNDADWFLKADDDTYVVVENLKYFLHDKNSSDPLAFGQVFQQPQDNLPYVTGGSGYVISKEALKRFAQRKKSHIKCIVNRTEEDMYISDCLQSLGVNIKDGNDKTDKTRFHFIPSEVLLAGDIPDFYKDVSKKKVATGINSLSDYAVTFHYVTKENMYNLEYLLYHLHPYGIKHELQG